MTTIGLIPSQVLASLNQDGEGNWLDVPEGQTVVPLIKTAPPPFDPATQKLAPAAPVWFADRVERQLAIVNLSAEELKHIYIATKRTSLANQIDTLRQWKADADTALVSWGADTTAQKFNKLQTVIDRFGKLSWNLADFLEAQRIDE
jgi:hypothetical protein